MEVNQISQLATILRENGDQILNSTCKFSLSANLLCTLNSSFALSIEQRDSVNSTFQVINNSNVKTETFRDLQFLHDFVQRTVSLKLTPSCIIGNLCTDIIDIAKFKNLKLLELHKVNATILLGLQALRTQLQFLICIRSINSIREVLEKCGADNSQGFIWCELKEATFSHNNLKNIDNSLEFAPWLHTLDLSHNNIRSAGSLNCLPNLKYLNLSYNHLEAVPAFTGQLCNRLQVLVLRNNFIEDLRELSGLINLCELDLSDNCLLEHEALASLAQLAALQWLSVEGNPLGFHPQHRTRTARFLHVNTATVRFSLDRIPLNKTEKKLVGSLHLIHTHTLQRPHLSSFCSTVSEGTLVASERYRRVRNATISENDQEDPMMDSSFASVASLVISGDHLETKQKIEQLRREYGETWLHSQGGGSLVQDALGLEKSLPMSSSPYEKEFLLHAKEVEIRPKEKTEITSEKSTNNTFTTATESFTSDTSLYAGEQVASPEPPPSDDDDEDLGEGEENLYLATVKDETEPVFVVLTNTHIWERECDSGKIRARWLLETLQSCELLGDNCTDVRLTFDTVKRDRQVRQYVLEADEATRLACVLNNILTNRPPEENKLVVYRCMKCSTQFSNEKERGRETPALECPACQSTVVIEDDEL